MSILDPVTSKIAEIKAALYLDIRTAILDEEVKVGFSHLMTLNPDHAKQCLADLVAMESK